MYVRGEEKGWRGYLLGERMGKQIGRYRTGKSLLEHK